MTISQELFRKAATLIPGGVNSPVRACKSVQCDPLFIAKASGSTLTTEDGKTLIDYVMSWGPMLLGHNHPGVARAIAAAAANGTSFGAPCRLEVELAQAVVDAVPGIEMVRMVSSGTEATMSALRLARGYTGRNGVIKFHGGYHGHADAFLASAGSGVATQSIPGTPGVPQDVVKHTLLAHYNDLDAVKALFEAHGDDIAAVIVEPVAGNMGLVLPQPGFLEGLRDLTRKYGAVLIFDEVITGFRVDFGGAQHIYGVDPDITCLGKIIGGGFPIGAFGGKRHIMDRLAPLGDVYQAGTLSGNPVAVRAGLYVLDFLRQNVDTVYARLKETVETLANRIAPIATRYEIPYRVNSLTGMFTGFFSEAPVTGYDAAAASDRDLYEKFFKAMLEEGIFFAPSQFEASFVTLTLDQTEIERTVAACERVFRGIRSI